MARPAPKSTTSAALSAEADALRRFVDLVSHRAGAALTRMKDASVTLPQVLLMTRIERAHTASISDLVKVSPGSAAAMSQMVDRLVRQNRLARSEDPTDRRQKTVSLTSTGAGLLRDLERARTMDYATGLSRLPSPLRAELRGWLARALAEIEREGSP
jgi:DNA-binding MarR family transcriptional regulator